MRRRSGEDEGVRPDLGLMFSFRNPAAWRRPFADVYRDELALIVHAEAARLRHHLAHRAPLRRRRLLARRSSRSPPPSPRARSGCGSASTFCCCRCTTPSSVAEDIATLDVLSNGRIDVGLGQGYARHEFAGYGIDRAERLRPLPRGPRRAARPVDRGHVLLRRQHYTIDDADAAAQAGAAADAAAVDRRHEHRRACAGPAGAARTCSGLTNPRLQEEYEQARAEAGFELETPRCCSCTGPTSPRPTTRPGTRPRRTSTTCSRVYSQWLDESDDAGNRARSDHRARDGRAAARTRRCCSGRRSVRRRAWPRSSTNRRPTCCRHTSPSASCRASLRRRHGRRWT